MNLPKAVKKTLYVHVGLGSYVYGDITVSDYKHDENGSGDGFERVTVSKFEIDIDLPENFDPEGAMVEILTTKKSKLEADHYVAVNRINDQINELLAITNTGEAK